MFILLGQESKQPFLLSQCVTVALLQQRIV